MVYGGRLSRNSRYLMKFGKLIIGVLLALQLDSSPLCGEESGHARAHDEDMVEPVQDPDVHFEAETNDRTGLSRYLFGHLHAFGVVGDSTTDPADLALGDHDPNNQIGLQGLEPSLSLQAGMLQGYVNGSGVTTGSGGFFFGLEEGFLELVDLPFGFKLRGGQFLNSVGFQNAVHNHGWKFVDQTLVNGRFLNEGELFSQGGEIAWRLPVLKDSQIVVSIGGLPAHSHGEEEHDDGGEFEAEGANFTDTLSSTNWVNRFEIDGERMLATSVSGVWGRNQYGRRNQVYGAGVEYLWREHRYDEHAHGGKFLRWRSEVMYRDVEALSGHLPGEGGDDHADDAGQPGRANFDELGIYSMLVYGFNDHIEMGARGGWVSGISQMGLEERYRVSPVITWYLNEKRTLQTRLQYNFDYLRGSGAEHSLWLQIGFNWESGDTHQGHDH